MGAEILFKGLNSRPGGAMIASIYQRKPLFCLSGNPFAALVGFEMVVRPALALLSARSDLALRRRCARLDLPDAAPALSAKPVRRFIRAFFADGVVSPPSENFSGQIFSLASCNCLLDIKAGEDIKQNDEVALFLL